MKKIRMILFWMMFLLLSWLRVAANNVTISNPVLTGKNTTDHFVMVQFDLSWENSWRTSAAPYNWDAAWVFVKYCVKTENGGDGVWKHAWLHNDGYTAGIGTDAVVYPALLNPWSAYSASTNPALGVFVYRSTAGSGTFLKTGIRLRWNYGANGVGDNTLVEFKVVAVEMVYVPQECFSAGDGATTNVSGQFTAHNTMASYRITSELSITLGGVTPGNMGNNNTVGMNYPDDFNNTITMALPSGFPKGYFAFYCMKYEISQQEYVDFLNSLTETQAASRYLANPPALSRYGLSGTPGNISTTNPYVACNWLSWTDLLGYLDWSGLRPMTELEYEKACRGPIPSVANAYAWGSTAITQNSGIFNPGAINEASLNGGNCNYGNHAGVQGPMRTGAFATASSTQIESGSSYYGIMDLSGNVTEPTVFIGSANTRSYTGLHGDGLLDTNGQANVARWPMAKFSLRGGDFYNPAAEAQISSRKWASGLGGNRLPFSGGRGVRTIILPIITTAAASGITNVAATSGGNITNDFGYPVFSRGVCWSTSHEPTLAGNHTSDGTGSGAYSSSLTNLSAGTTYYIRAYATNDLGTAYGNEVSFSTLVVFTCGTSTITVNHVTSGGVAPENKSVTYGTVTNIPGQTSKCWITSNLGADHQADSVSDDTEASAGWYWQFNKKQGYKNDGNTRTPNTPWLNYFEEGSDWIAANDPCALELGNQWRLPTSTEWFNVDEAGGWDNWNGAWGSGLKLHAAGELTYVDGSLLGRGTSGSYWSSTQEDANSGLFLFFHNQMSLMVNNLKAFGLSIRCIRNN